MTTLRPTQTVATVVLDHSECAPIFQRHRIDYCCRGEVSIEEAARERGLDLDALMRELDQAITERRGVQPASMTELSTEALVKHIVGTHHAYLRKALPFVRVLATKVARVHGDHNPKLRDLDEAVDELTEALLPHLDEEEQSLFPALQAGEQGPVLDTVMDTMLDAMMDDHLAVAALLERIRNATDDFALPEWACGSYRTLFGELQALERDTFTHVHLENHVLKPRFEQARAAAAG
jgi:regulator of cell morphogenesis and NO signaling